MARYDEIKNKIESLMEELQEIKDDHDSIKATDEQYSDPEMWWAGPLLENLESAVIQMEEES